MSKRKRKKKRKKKLPKTSSSSGLARRRQRQWHVPGPCALQRQVPAVPRVHCVSLRHVVGVPVVRFVQFLQVLFFGFYTCPVEKASRSKMNVPLLIRGGDEALEMKFLAAKDPGGGSYPAYLRGKSWDEASGRRVQGRNSFSLLFRERISRLNCTTWRSSLQSSIISWADWNVVNYAVLGPNSQAIRGLYAVVPGQGYWYARCCARCHFHGSMVFDIFVVAQRQLPWSAYSADHRDCPVAAH